MQGRILAVAISALLLSGLSLSGFSQARAEEKAAEKKADSAFAAQDKGPATIDVSKYPKEMQESYPIFEKRCSKCHTLARPINSTYALPDEWERYIKRMMRKPGSGINPADGKKIFDFLTYDSSIRKKDLIEKKKKEQPAGKEGGK